MCIRDSSFLFFLIWIGRQTGLECVTHAKLLMGGVPVKISKVVCFQIFKFAVQMELSVNSLNYFFKLFRGMHSHSAMKWQFSSKNVQTFLQGKNNWTISNVFISIFLVHSLSMFLWCLCEVWIKIMFTTCVFDQFCWPMFCMLVQWMPLLNSFFHCVF